MALNPKNTSLIIGEFETTHPKAFTQLSGRADPSCGGFCFRLVPGMSLSLSLFLSLSNLGAGSDIQFFLRGCRVIESCESRLHDVAMSSHAHTRKALRADLPTPCFPKYHFDGNDDVSS